MVHPCVIILIFCITKIHCQFDFGDDYGFPPFFDSDTSNFGNIFRSIDNMAAKMHRDMEIRMKPMKISQAKRSMVKGFGGTTLVQMGDQIFITKDATTFRCLGQVISQRPFCEGPKRRFQIQNRHDYCYSNNYSQIGDVLCIADVEQHGITFVKNDGNMLCSGSDERPTLLIDLLNYKELCGRLPWEITYYYYPDLSDPFHVKLPDPDLPCLEQRPDLCVFYDTKKNILDF